jgi:hypothetical protein
MVRFSTSRQISPMASTIRVHAERACTMLALAALAACGGEAEAPAGPPLPAGVSPVAAEARIATQLGSERACQPASIREVFREPAEWNGYWQFGFAEHCPKPQLPAGFDFTKEMAVLVAMGPRSSPADSIQVQGVGTVGDSVLVVVRRVTRQDGCDEPTVDAYPRDLVRVPLATGPTRFVEQQIKLPCPQA